MVKTRIEELDDATLARLSTGRVRYWSSPRHRNGVASVRTVHSRMSSPIIAVTGTADSLGSSPRRVRVNEAYTNAIAAAGLIPLVVPPITGDAFAARVLDAVDGLVLTGGEDVEPRLFGAARHPATHAPNAPRDECELSLARQARERGLPTLAICRGLQLLNVENGGSLVQDIPTERPGALPHDLEGDRSARVHSVRLVAGSRLAQIVGEETVATNSFHHQAIDRLGDGLRIVGQTSDGIVEGIESDDEHWWMVGVQWHPEELTATPEPWDRQIFAAFADAVRSRIDRRISSTAASAPRPAPAASAAPASRRSEKTTSR
jgi:putative glutamine amidotransferase